MVTVSEPCNCVGMKSFLSYLGVPLIIIVGGHANDTTGLLLVGSSHEVCHEPRTKSNLMFKE